MGTSTRTGGTEGVFVIPLYLLRHLARDAVMEGEGRTTLLQAWNTVRHLVDIVCAEFTCITKAVVT